MPSPSELALRFVEVINCQDLAGMERLISEGHRFTDSLGRAVEGRPLVLSAWKGYFRWMPDYRIDVHQVLAEGRVVGMFGVARGTFAPTGELIEENHWELPAAFRAVVGEGSLESWQVYADNKPVYEIMGRTASK